MDNERTDELKEHGGRRQSAGPLDPIMEEEKQSRRLSTFSLTYLKKHSQPHLLSKQLYSENLGVAELIGNQQEMVFISHAAWGLSEYNCCAFWPFPWKAETERGWEFWETAERNNVFCPQEKSCFGSLYKFHGQVGTYLLLLLTLSPPSGFRSNSSFFIAPSNYSISFVNSPQQVRWAMGRTWHTLTMSLQNHRNWQMMGSLVMPLKWDTGILNHTSANGIYHFDMFCFLFFFFKIRYLKLAWGHAASKGI